MRRATVERALDASFLSLEECDNPMHVGGVLVLEAPPHGLAAIESLVEERLPLVPRYRQRVLEITGYDGCVFVGLDADRDSVADVDVLADLIEQEVAELVRTSR